MKNNIFRIIRKLTLNYYPFRKDKNSLLILIYHKVNDDKVTFFPAVPIKAFEETCLFLKKHYQVIHFSEIEVYYSKERKRPAAIITFDDGLLDIIENAFPIIQKLDLKCNVNIDTEILETHLPQDFVRVYDMLNYTQINSFFNPNFMSDTLVIDQTNPSVTEIDFTKILTNLSCEKRREFVTEMSVILKMDQNRFSKVLSNEHIIDLKNSGIVEFGSHSHSHSLLTKITNEEIKHELSHSKNILEKLIGEKINIIAYPNGESNEEIDILSREIGYKFLLKSNHEINQISKQTFEQNCYERINQYHQTKEIILAHTFGIVKLIKKVINK